MPELAVENLACRRGGRTVFAGLGFTLEAGGALLLTGANGSGKSSLLRTLALLVSAYRGAILWRGRDVRADRDAWCRTIGWLGHADAIKADLSVGEMLRLAASLADAVVARSRADLDAACGSAAARFGLADLLDRPCRYLSAGQRRRVALARLIANGAPLWLMDEPAAALDTESVTSLHREITEHCRSGGMAIVATHGDITLAGAAQLDLDRFAHAEPAPDAAA